MYESREERNYNGTSLIFSTTDNNGTDDRYPGEGAAYDEFRILGENKISSFLELSVSRYDGETCFSYDVSGRRSLKKFYDGRELEKEELFGILTSVKMALETVSRFLLDENHLILDPERIYINHRRTSAEFIYFPYYDKPLGESLKEFMEFILEYTNHEDEESVELIYELYSDVENEDYSFASFEKRRKIVNGNRSPDMVDRDIQRDTESEDKESVNRVEEKEAGNGIDIINFGEGEYSEIGEESSTDYAYIRGSVYVVILILLLGFVLYIKINSGLTKHYIRSGLIVILIAVAAAVDITALLILLLKQRRNRSNSRPSAPVEYHRLVRKGDGRREEMEIDHTPYTIGKMEGYADGVVDEHAVSRIHARIIKENGAFYIEDLNSTNGTFVNRERLKTHEKRVIYPGDEISFSSAVYSFV